MCRTLPLTLALLLIARAPAAEPSNQVAAPDVPPPLAIRVENVTVAPTHGPVLAVQLQRFRQPASADDKPEEIELTLRPPEGWKIASRQQTIKLGGAALGRATFPVERGVSRDDNDYPVEVTARIGGRTVVHRQNVVCSTAPYFKPAIDGDPAEWKDAIPVGFTSGGKKTTVSTYWNRKEFALLVAVEEDALRPWKAGVAPGEAGAVQVALSPRDPAGDVTPTAGDTAGRYEYLLVATGDGMEGKCFRLAEPDTIRTDAQQERPLGPLEYADAKVAVRRVEGVTYYEASLPFGPMKDRIRPGEGREFYLSLLIHDPHGSGPRDLGATPGLSLVPQGPAWSRWQGGEMAGGGASGTSHGVGTVELEVLRKVATLSEL